MIHSIILCLYSLINSKLIKAPLIIVTGKAVTYLNLSSHNHSSFFIISQNSKFTILNNRFKKKINITKANITIRNESITCEKKLEKASIANIIFNFEYYSILKRSNMNNVNNALALSYYFNNERNNFLNQLKNNNIIENKIYGFEPELTKEKNGNFYIGEIPKSIILRKNKVKCPIIINNKSRRWGCKVNKIYIENFYNKSFHNQIVTFAVERMKTVIPLEILLFINNTVLKNLYKKGDCFYKSIFNNKKIFCKKEIISNLPKINFEFYNFCLILNLENLFIGTINKNNSKIVFLNLNIDINKEDDNEWVLGWDFLISYISKFDYDKKIITFYSNDVFLSTKDKGRYIQINSILKYLFYILFIGIFFELIIMIKFKI